MDSISWKCTLNSNNDSRAAETYLKSIVFADFYSVLAQRKWNGAFGFCQGIYYEYLRILQIFLLFLLLTLSFCTGSVKSNLLSELAFTEKQQFAKYGKASHKILEEEIVSSCLVIVDTFHDVETTLFTLIKIQKFHLIFWCGNFVERYSFRAKKFGEILVFYAEFLNMGRLVFSVNICDILSKNKNYETYLCEVLC